MPRLSAFRGIVIAVYWDDYPPPHFHASYAGRDVQVSIEPLVITRGSLPPRVEHRILAWAKAHRRDLKQAWDDVQAGQPPSAIDLKE